MNRTLRGQEVGRSSRRVIDYNYVWPAFAGIGMAVVGAFQLTSTGAATFYFIGTAVVGASLWLPAHTRGVRCLNAASMYLQRGELDRARDWLAKPATRWLPDAAFELRTGLSWVEGDFVAVREAADRFLARGTMPWSPWAWIRRVRCASLRAMRAFVRANEGDPKAREDIEAVRRDPWATVGTIQRAELAEATLLAKSGELRALGDHLAQHRVLLLESAAARERALVREHMRACEQRAQSPYRVAESREREWRAPSPVERWVRAVLPDTCPTDGVAGAPDTADHAEAVREATAKSVESVAHSLKDMDPDAVKALDQARRQAARARIAHPGRRAAKPVFLWVLLVLMFLAVWHFFSTTPASSRHRAIPESNDVTVQEQPRESAGNFSGGPLPAESLPLIITLGLFVILFVRPQRSLERAQRHLFDISRQIARGDADDADEAFSLAIRMYQTTRVAAMLARAAWAERDAQFEFALRDCDQVIALFGIRSASARAPKERRQNPVLAMAIAQRAVVLAALDRAPEASAELAILERDFSGLPLQPSAAAASLVLCTRRGDLTAAATLVAETAPDQWSYRTSVLADLVTYARPAQTPSDVREEPSPGFEGLHREIRANPRLERWLDAVAPGLLSRVRAQGHPSGEPIAAASA